MKTFSFMCIPDLLLTKDAYQQSIERTKTEIARCNSESGCSDKKIEDLKNKVSRLKELHDAVCLEFPKMSFSEYKAWIKTKSSQPAHQ
jgi:hypothetical protein